VLGRLAAASYFLHCVLILQIVGLFEEPRALPVSLRQNVVVAAFFRRFGRKPMSHLRRD